MSETANYQLYVTDDDTTAFKDWREKINGPEDSNMTKIDTALAGKAEKSVSVDATLEADAWVGAAAPFTQDISVPGLGAEQNGSASVARGATVEQEKAAEDAVLKVTGQAEGQLTISASGEKPAVDIPVTITLLG